MSYTIAEKILKTHSKVEEIIPGQIIEAEIDLIMVHEQLSPRIHKEYEKLGLDKVWDPNKKIFYLGSLDSRTNNFSSPNAPRLPTIC